MIMSFTILLYRYLYENAVMDLYQCHQTNLISPIELAAIIKEEISKGRIQLNDDKTRITLTDYGRKWIETNKLYLFAEEKEKEWRHVPEDMKYKGDELFDSLFDINDLQNLVDNL